MDALWLDFRFALRTLRRCPGFAVVAILVLALGIGACTAIFSVVNAVLLKPLPYAHAERMAVVWERRQQDTLNAVQASNYGVTPADYLDWRAQNHVFSSLTAHDQRSFNLDGADGAERVVGVLATADMFATYGVQPVLGRGFTRSEEDNGAHVALLAHGLWTRCFGADPQILNRTIRLDGESYQVIGVLPAGFRMFFGRSTDLYVPLYLSPQQRHDRGAHDLLPIGRLAPGVSAQQALQSASSLSGNIPAPTRATAPISYCCRSSSPRRCAPRCCCCWAQSRWCC
jgi:putative ABC transport system permease protein